jgi:hypothetical protein
LDNKWIKWDRSQGTGQEEKARGSKNRSWSINPHLPHPNPTNRLYRPDSGVGVGAKPPPDPHLRRANPHLGTRAASVERAGRVRGRVPDPLRLDGFVRHENVCRLLEFLGYRTE